jgi:hypothetical protein
MIKVLGIKIIDRIKEAGLTQGILSKYSAVITTRLGFHEVSDSVCSREAYVILHLNDNQPDTGVLVTELKALGGIEVREVTFKGEEKMPDAVKTNGIEILCVLVERDQQVIQSVQKVLTSYGCNIRTRLGVNEVFFGEPAGLIVLELKGDENQRILLEKDLKAIGHVHVRSMIF